MSDDEIRDALERAADVVPDPDLSQTAWYAGRSRKRRTSRAWWGAGAAAAAAAVIGAVAWGGFPLLGDSGPAGTAGDEAGQTATVEPTPGPDAQGMHGQPEVLAFTSGDGALEHTGVLQPWTGDSGSETTWRLMDDLGQEPLFPDGAGITLAFDGSTWSLRGCGLSMRAEGTMSDGRVDLTGDWAIEPDPDPGASCVWHTWLDPDRWQSFFDSAPVVGQDGTSLLLSGSVGAEPTLEHLAVGFARTGVTDPETAPARAATWEDLAAGWVEAPVDDDLVAAIPEHTFVGHGDGTDPPVELTSPQAGEVSIGGGCGPTLLDESWLLDTGGTAAFLDPHAFFTASLCEAPGAEQQSMVTSLLRSGGTVTVHGDYLVVQGWVDVGADDPQDPTDTRPAALNPPVQLTDLTPLSQAKTLLPEVLAVPGDGILPLADDPTDRFTAAIVLEDDEVSLLVLGSDQRWRTAATGVGGMSRDGQFALIPPLVDTSISPTGEWLAYRAAFSTNGTDGNIVIVTASTGEVREFPTDGEWPDNFPNDFFWLDDDRLAVDLREDRAMVVDASSGQVTHDTSWSEARELTPWHIVVQAPDDMTPGPVVLQQWDAAGEVVEEVPLDFTASPGGESVLAEDRVTTLVRTEDVAVIEPGWDGVTPESVDLVLTLDGTQETVNVLQADRSFEVFPVRWVDRGSLIVHVWADDRPHYLLWDTQNGGVHLLTEPDLPTLRSGPVFGSIVP